MKTFLVGWSRIASLRDGLRSHSKIEYYLADKNIISLH